MRCPGAQPIFIFQAIALVQQSTRYIVPKLLTARDFLRNISGYRSIAKDSGSAKAFWIAYFLSGFFEHGHGLAPICARKLDRTKFALKEQCYSSP
jgi:hypothetical protein